MWIVEEAWRQVGRAGTAEDRARALSTFRRAIATATKPLGEVTPELAEWLERLQIAAEVLYEGSQDEHVRKALRGLASLRMAVDARLSAGQGREPVGVALTGPAGEHLATIAMPDGSALMGSYGIPAEFHDGNVIVQIGFDHTGEVKVRKGRRITWRLTTTREGETR
jgi:hypothetical protein